MSSGLGPDSDDHTSNLPEDAADDSSPTPSSPIPDLLSEFSALLSPDRYVPRNNRRYNDWGLKPTPHIYTPPDPKLWTGTFHLLSLPREIRDAIYTYALYSPSGLLFTMRPLRRAKHGCHKPDPLVDISLFLVSRQIYAEAFLVFWRCNWIRIGPKSSFKSHLRLFPEPARSLVRNVNVRFHDGTSAWSQICMNAKELQEEWFPRLRRCRAEWVMRHAQWSAELGLEVTDGGIKWEDKVSAFEGWLRSQYVVGGNRPPKYLSVVFVGRYPYDHEDMSGLTQMFGEAWKNFKREITETRKSREEELAEGLEESARKWLEEEWGVDGKEIKKRKGKRKSVAGSP